MSSGELERRRHNHTVRDEVHIVHPVFKAREPALLHVINPYYLRFVSERLTKSERLCKRGVEVYRRLPVEVWLQCLHDSLVSRYRTIEDDSVVYGELLLSRCRIVQVQRSESVVLSVADSGIERQSLEAIARSVVVKVTYVGRLWCVALTDDDVIDVVSVCGRQLEGRFLSIGVDEFNLFNGAVGYRFEFCFTVSISKS